MRPSGPSSARAAATLAQSWRRSDPGSATFTFAVMQPPLAAISRRAWVGETTGIVTLTSTRSRTGAGNGRVAASRPACNQLADSVAP